MNEQLSNVTDGEDNFFDDANAKYDNMIKANNILINSHYNENTHIIKSPKKSYRYLFHCVMTFIFLFAAILLGIWLGLCFKFGTAANTTWCPH